MNASICGHQNFLTASEKLQITYKWILKQSFIDYRPEQGYIEYIYSRKVLVQKIQESERPAQLSMFDQMLVLVMSYVIIVKRRYSY